MAATLGQQLRKARESSGITLGEISEHTRISTRYLEAIEQDNYKNLPGGIFNKSFVKAFAKEVGFDEKEALDAYSITAKSLGEDVDDAPIVTHRSSDAEQTRSPIVSVLLAVVILAILSLGAYSLLHWYQRNNATPDDAQQLPKTNAAPQGTQPIAQPVVQQSSLPHDGFSIQLRAQSEEVWARIYMDDAHQPDLTLHVGEARDFTPQRSLKIVVSKDKAAAVSVSVNGRPALITPVIIGKVAEILIAKENLPPLQ